MHLCLFMGVRIFCPLFQDLTNQVLQTEDRWTVEIEKQRQSFELEVSISLH